MRELRLGTRGSQLALWQANAVAARLAERGAHCRIEIIKTSGDRLQEAPLSEVGGKRLFVKEIEDALLRQDIDLAVHSSKDMPAVLTDGLTIAAVLPREDPLDAIVLPVMADGSWPMAPNAISHQPSAIADALLTTLGASPRIGTGSVRRIAQLIRLMPDARFMPIRGNLDTRLRKLDGGEYDALVLAAAGLRRLGLASRITMTVPAAACVPAPGQGIVAIEIRTGDEDVRRAVEPLSDPVAAAALDAERTLVAALGGGCQTPIGALASPLDADDLELSAIVVSLDGRRAVQARGRGRCADASAIGMRVAKELLAGGARDILAEALGRQSAANPRSAAMTGD